MVQLKDIDVMVYVQSVEAGAALAVARMAIRLGHLTAR